MLTASVTSYKADGITREWICWNAQMIEAKPAALLDVEFRKDGSLA
jgi:hypothetical protein